LARSSFYHGPLISPKTAALEAGGKGEDALSYTETLIAVADGVGGWAE